MELSELVVLVWIILSANIIHIVWPILEEISEVDGLIGHVVSIFLFI